MTKFVDNAAAHRFELTEDGHTAFAQYCRAGQKITIPHVEAPPALQGKGTAGRLMEAIVALARAQDLKIAPTCPYAIAWFQRHPEHKNILIAG